MQFQQAPAAIAFAKALRSFQTGGIAYTDFLGSVRRQLDAGAAASDLLDILRRREAVESLPRHAHEALIELLENREPDAADGRGPQEAPTIVLGETDSADDPGSPSRSADGLDGAVTVGDVLLNRFRLVELVGEGGMSRVFKAVDSTRSDAALPAAYVSVKVLTRPFNDESGSFSMFEEEVRRLRGLSHPNIVRMFGCDREGAMVFMTMEYLDGDSLYARMRAATSPAGARAGIGPETAQAIITAVAGALDHAHRHDIVHGDLKPGNVILTAQGEIKVIDFAIANWVARPRTASERREAAQRQLASAVTPRYASPQLMARNKPDAADDVYALACVAYELLTGIHPFDEGSGTQTLRYPALRAGLNSAQYAAILKGLKFERRLRTPTVAQFIEEFRAPDRRAAWRWSALGVLAAVALAAAGWFYSRPSKVQMPPPAPEEATTSEVFATPPATPTGSQAGAVLRDCATCPSMRVLPRGHFDQGSARSATAMAATHDSPVHLVVIGYPFAMSTNDVTVGEFRQFALATGRPMQGCDIYDGRWRRQPKADWQQPGFLQTESHPVTCVSWNDAVAYARWLSAKAGHQYRLPSASEWEYAARGGDEAEYPWLGATATACRYANVADQSAERRYPGWQVFACDDGYVNTAPVGSFKANLFGLNDMLGNVFQWTQDCWHDTYRGAPNDGAPRMDGHCGERELRGGSWFSSPPYLRASYRNHFARDYRTSSVGFRLVREINQ